MSATGVYIAPVVIIATRTVLVVLLPAVALAIELLATVVLVPVGIKVELKLRNTPGRAILDPPAISLGLDVPALNPAPAAPGGDIAP